MRNEDFPLWIPQAVRVLAVGLGVFDRRVNRFIQDDRMIPVWAELQKQKKIDVSGFVVLEPPDALADFGLDAPAHFSNNLVSVQDQACAAFFYVVLVAIRRREDIILTRKRSASWAAPYLEAAERCLWIKSNEYFQPRQLSPELIKAIDLVEQHCRDCAVKLVQVDNPYFLDRSSGDRGDDSVRGHVRALASFMRAVYGSVLYGTLATAVNVAFAPAHPISGSDVRKWSRGLGDRRVS